MHYKIILLFLIVIPVFSFAQSQEELFNKVKTIFTKQIPEKFSCNIEGETLRSSMQKLPKEAIENPKLLKIIMLFHQQYGTKVILKGVYEPYADRFSYIEGVFEFLTPFLGKNTYKNFQEKYELFDIKNSTFKIRKKLTSGTYLEITLENNQLSNVKEYKNGKLLMNTFIIYTSVEKKYFMPADFKVFYYGEDKLKILKFNLTEFDFNPKINEEDFLG